jgi:pimeloyl-ACP methyl ester carboxylesterase
MGKPVIALLKDICRVAGVWRALPTAAGLLFGVSTICNAQGQKTETGYMTSLDGVRLYYAKVGNGSDTVIVPGRLFMFRDFQQLAKGRTLIFYDMRNRGLSDLVADTSKISLQRDADDLEAVREHFLVQKASLIGFSYLGKMVILYATQHSEHVSRIVQIGPVARVFGTSFRRGSQLETRTRCPIR